MVGLLCNVARAGHVDHSGGVGFFRGQGHQELGPCAEVDGCRFDHTGEDEHDGKSCLGLETSFRRSVVDGIAQEFCGMKMMTSPGRSALAGQTLSPYVGPIKDGETILGHSVGIEDIVSTWL